MRERYETIFRLEQGLYTASSPLAVTAGALMRDGLSGNLLCQLRFLNLSSRTVKAIQVELELLDGENQPLGKPLEHRFTDLMLKRDEEYGQRSAIVVPEKETRGFRVRVTEAAFLDGGGWRSKPGPWEKLKKPKTLEEAYEDEGLAEQFRVRYGADCRYAPMEDGELWLCTCGSYNRAEESRCHRCRRSLHALGQIRPEVLRAERAEQLQRRQVREKRDLSDAQVRRKTLLRRLAIGIPALLLAMALLASVIGLAQRNREYQAALELISAGRLEEADRRLELLGGYRSSRELREKRIPYLRAGELVRRAQANDGTALQLIGLAYSDLEEGVTPAMVLYDAAREIYLSLGDYEDSARLAEQCAAARRQGEEDLRIIAYRQASSLLEDGYYSQAREGFLALGDYEDSAEQARECVYRKASALMGLIGRMDLSEVRAELSMEPEGTSVFSLSNELVRSLGSASLGDLRRACGEDFVDIRLSDTPDESLPPLTDQVRTLLGELGDYKDSAQLLDTPPFDPAAVPEEPEQAEQAEPQDQDPGQPLYALLEQGDYEGAMSWLEGYTGDWDAWEDWYRQLRGLKGWFRDWSFDSGDPTLLPVTFASGGQAYSLRSAIVVREGAAWLVLSDPEGDLRAEFFPVEGRDAYMAYSGAYHYFVLINDQGKLACIKYDSQGRSWGSCSYSPAED